jgi:hypothetical protein
MSMAAQEPQIASPVRPVQAGDPREGMGAVIWLALSVVGIVVLVFAVNYFLL